MRPNASIAQLVTPPDIEPITLSQVKEHLRVDGGDEDALITTLITVARERIEQETRRAFIRQKWTAYILGDFGNCLPVELPRPRLMPEETFLLEYRDTDAAWQESADAMVQVSREPALVWANATTYPADIDSPRSPQDAVWRATYWAGYGSDAASVPGAIKHAIMLLVAHLFERREMVISGATITEVPKSLDWLLDSYRVPWEGAVK